MLAMKTPATILAISITVTKYRTTMIDQALAVADQNRNLPLS